MEFKKTYAKTKIPTDAFIYTTNNEVCLTDLATYEDQKSGNAPKGPRHHYFERTKTEGLKFVKSFWRSQSARQYNWLISEGKTFHGAPMPAKAKAKAKPTVIETKKKAPKKKGQLSKGLANKLETMVEHIPDVDLPKKPAKKRAVAKSKKPKAKVLKRRVTDK